MAKEVKEEVKTPEVKEEVKEEVKAEPLTFNERVMRVQTELKAPKGQRNEFGKYNYRSCEDIFEALKPLLAKYELVLVIGDELIQLGDRIYVKATARLFDAKGEGHENYVLNTAFAREEDVKKGMDGSQITGASSSYARKYALNGLFLIDDTKDSDATNTHGKEEKKESKATPEQIKQLQSLFDAERIQKMLTYYKIEKIEDLTLTQASEAIKMAKGGK